MTNLFLLEPITLKKFMELCETLETAHMKGETINLLIKHNGHIEPSLLSVLFEKIQNGKVSFTTSALGNLQRTDLLLFLLGKQRIVYPDACIQAICLDFERAIKLKYFQAQMKEICIFSNIDFDAAIEHIKRTQYLLADDCIKYGIAHQIGGNL